MGQIVYGDGGIMMTSGPIRTGGISAGAASVGPAVPVRETPSAVGQFGPQIVVGVAGCISGRAAADLAACDMLPDVAERDGSDVRGRQFPQPFSGVSALGEPLAVDDYRDNRVTGSLVLVDELTNATVAAGMVGRASFLAAPAIA